MKHRSVEDRLPVYKLADCIRQQDLIGGSQQVLEENVLTTSEVLDRT